MKSTRKPTLYPHSFSPFVGNDNLAQRIPTGSPSCLMQVTTNLLTTYRKCNSSFRYLSSANPRRVITKPSQGVSNNNYDNINADIIFYVNDVLGLQQKHKYLVLDLLGQGTFGQVVKCKRLDTGELLAVKAVKNRPAYYNQGMFEVHILELLNSRYDPDLHNMVQLKDYFIDRQHLCIVFELLSVNMFDLIKQNQYRGLSTNLIRVFLRQILKTLRCLQDCGIIHCDLKPENILLRNQTSPQIKLIDFGSACYENQTVYTYIQSRFYRSPEVIIGFPYNSAIDMWSLGCIAAELFLGLPLFPGHNEYNQLVRILEMQGDLPEQLLRQGKFVSKFYSKAADEGGYKLQLKTEEQYCHEQNAELKPFKRYFHSTKLNDIIQNYRYKKNLSEEQLQKEKRTRVAFTDFLMGLLKLDPVERWTAEQASHHPFITGEPFTGPFVPPPAKIRDTAIASVVSSSTTSRAWASAPLYPQTSTSPSLMTATLPEHGHSFPMHPSSLSHPLNLESSAPPQSDFNDHAPQHQKAGRRSRSISVDTKRSLKPSEPLRYPGPSNTRGGASAQPHKAQRAGNYSGGHQPYHGSSPSAKPSSTPGGHDKRGTNPGPNTTAKTSNDSKSLNIPNSSHGGGSRSQNPASRSPRSGNSTSLSLPPTSLFGGGASSQDKQQNLSPQMGEKHSPRQNHRGNSPRGAKSPRRTAGTHHKSSPPDSHHSANTSHPHNTNHNSPTNQQNSSSGNNKKHAQLAKRGKAASLKAGTGASLARNRQAQRKPPDKSSTWPGPVALNSAASLPEDSAARPLPPEQQRQHASSQQQNSPQQMIPVTKDEPSSVIRPVHSTTVPTNSDALWDTTYFDEGLLFYEASSIPSSVPVLPLSSISTRVSPTQSKTSPRGQARGKGQPGASQPISIKQNRRRSGGTGTHTGRWGSHPSAASFSEYSEPLMPMLDPSSPSSYGVHWGDEDINGTSDLVFGVSPTAGGGFYGVGRGAQISSSPHGGVGELLTPPRHHFVPPPGGAQWSNPVHASHHHTSHLSPNYQQHSPQYQQHSPQYQQHGLSYQQHSLKHPQQPNLQYQQHSPQSHQSQNTTSTPTANRRPPTNHESSDVPAITQRLAASSIESIDADSATDHTVVND